MEKLARWMVILLLFLAAGLPLAVKPTTVKAGVIELRGRMPENGGWSLDWIEGEVNQPLKLRLTSDDVVHGFAVGKSGLPSVNVLPGEYSETVLIFNEPGEYTFYCTRWCGVNHWRMRGTIHIEGDKNGTSETRAIPMFLQLAIDLDAPHLAKNFPSSLPSTARGALLTNWLPNIDHSFEIIWSSSPEQTFQRYRTVVPASNLDDQNVWDMVAWALNQQASSDWLAEAETLYYDNCLACHGENGKGDGVMMRDLPPYNPMKMGMEIARPPDFSDPSVLTGASPALLEGKIIRGGMGTGMPNWGQVFTDKQIQALVLYLYRFQFDLEEIP